MNSNPDFDPFAEVPEPQPEEVTPVTPEETARLDAVAPLVEDEVPEAEVVEATPVKADGKDNTRPYIILEQIELDDDGVAYTPVGREVAFSPEQALRNHVGTLDPAAIGVYVPVAERHWKVLKPKAKPRPSSITF